MWGSGRLFLVPGRSAALLLPARRVPRHARLRGCCRTLALVAIAGAPWGGSLEAQDVAIKVVVNEANPVTSLSSREVSQLFLKKKDRFEGGFRAIPVDQTLESAVRESFSKKVLKREASAIQGYWMKMVFSGLGVPPQELRSDAEVLDFVAHNVGAIGYVAATAPAVGSVKTLTITEPDK